MPKPTAMIFDKDGTLFDFRKSWGAWAKAALDGLAVDIHHRASLADVLGFDDATSNFRPDSLVIAGTTGEVAEAIFPLMSGWRLPALSQRLNDLAEAAPMAPAVDLRPLFVQLRGRGLRLGLATNDAEAPARAHLAGAGVADLFDFVAGYDSGWGGKPAPGQLLAFAQAVGVSPGDCVMIGDSLHDLHAARAAGMAAVAVLTGMAEAETLAPHADAVLPDIGHLPGWLDQQR